MGLLKDIIGAVSDNNTNIISANVKSKAGKVGIIELSIELDNIDTFKKVINSIQAIPDVYSVKRIQTSAHHATQCRSKSASNNNSQKAKPQKKKTK